MSTNAPMTQEQLDAIRARPLEIWAELVGERKAPAYHHAQKDLTDLLAEVERLRALTTVTDDMVERAARAMMEASPDSAYITEDEREWYVRDARAALHAALHQEQP